MGPKTMQRAILHVQRYDTDTLAILHNEVQSKIFDKKVGVVSQGLPVKCVEKGMTSTISGSSTTVSLSPFAVFQ